MFLLVFNSGKGKDGVLPLPVANIKEREQVNISSDTYIFNYFTIRPLRVLRQQDRIRMCIRIGKLMFSVKNTI